MYMVGIDGGKLGSDPKDLADATGGVFGTSTKATDETQLLGGFTAQINGSYAFTYKSAITKGVNDLGLVIGDTSTRVRTSSDPSCVAPKRFAFQPPVVQLGQRLSEQFRKCLATSGTRSGQRSPPTAIVGIAVKDRSGLASVLQPYSEGYVARTVA